MCVCDDNLACRSRLQDNLVVACLYSLHKTCTKRYKHAIEPNQCVKS